MAASIEGNTYDAELVGADSSSDVAVLKAKDANGLTPMDDAEGQHAGHGRAGEAREEGAAALRLGAGHGLAQPIFHVSP